MDRKKQTKFGMLILRERIRKNFLPFALVIIFAALTIAFNTLDRVNRTQEEVNVTVLSWSNQNSKNTGQNTTRIWAELPDGRKVWVETRLNNPHIEAGSVIKVFRVKTGTGRTIYRWNW